MGTTNSPKYWIEKTIVKNRKDRIEGERALGKSLWSPREDKRKADIYKNMRAIKKGDIILHLIDNEKIAGLSTVANEYIETEGLPNTEWAGPAYLVLLNDYTELSQPLFRDDFLNEDNKEELMEIKNESEVFYNKKMELRQGAYLTPCSAKLLKLINDCYVRKTGSNLPYFNIKDENGPKKEKHVQESFVIQQEKTIIDDSSLPKVNKFDFKKLKSDLKKAGLLFEDKLVERFVSSLLTKPFVILTGLSGSGKTKLAQSFATWICSSDMQYCIVPVGSDWTNREPLLGFPNALSHGEYVKPDNRVLDLIIEAAKKENSTIPFFLILDEMNLSHVERYFADFLSVMETDEKIPLHAGNTIWKDVPPSIKLPKNLFILGTVNIDETTYMFSPKVLDRANVIEFRVTSKNMNTYLENIGTVDLSIIKGSGEKQAKAFTALSRINHKEASQKNELRAILIKFFNELRTIGAEFGHRTASEITRYVNLVNSLGLKWNIDDIIDTAIMQKLLPKVHGSRRKLEPVLTKLGQLCLKGDENIENYLDPKKIFLIDSLDDNENVTYPIALEKIVRMYRNLLHNGYTSYAEA